MKRTLAILVAAVLFLGMFAVAASAAVPLKNVADVGFGPGQFPGDTFPNAAVSKEIYVISLFDADAKVETPIPNTGAYDFDAEAGKKIEARVELGINFEDFLAGTYPQVEDFAAEDFKLIWYVSDDNGVFNFGKAGTKSDTFEVKAADIGRSIALFLVYSKDSIVWNDPIPAVGFDDYYAVLVSDPITGMTYSTAEGYAYDVVMPLVNAKVLNIEQITGLGLTKANWIAETIAPFGALDSYVDALNKAYRAANKAEDDYDAWFLASFAGATAAQKLAAERKRAAASEAMWKAVQALENATDALADDIFDNAAKIVDDFIALLEGWDTTNVSLEDQAKMVRAISAAKVAKFNIIQLRRLLDAAFDAKDRIELAGRAVDETKTLDWDILDNLLKNKPEMTDAEKKALEDKIKELEDALKDLIDNPVIITPPPVKIVAIDAIYDFFAGLIGGNFFTNVLSWITRYVLFGWLWSPIKYVLA